MKHPAQIVLRLQSIDEILLACHPSFYCKRKLNKDVEEFIIKEASAFWRRSPITLTIQIPKNEVVRTEELIIAIHEHFAFCKQKSDKQLKHVFQLGWRNLLIGFVFLGVMFLLSEASIRLLPQGGLAITFREALIILGWVALWRPAELLLYEWYPFKRDAVLFGRLEQSMVEVVTKTD